MSDEKGEQPKAEAAPSMTQRIAEALAHLSEEDVDVAALAYGDEVWVWTVPRLWDLARDLPVNDVAVETLLHYFDTGRWFGEDEPVSIRAVVEHARRIMRTDLSYPVILSAEGRILDGMHRIAKAWILDIPTIAMVRFAENPEPDARIPYTR